MPRLWCLGLLLPLLLLLYWLPLPIATAEADARPPIEAPPESGVPRGGTALRRGTSGETSRRRGRTQGLRRPWKLNLALSGRVLAQAQRSDCATSVLPALKKMRPWSFHLSQPVPVTSQRLSSFRALPSDSAPLSAPLSASLSVLAEVPGSSSTWDFPHRPWPWEQAPKRRSGRIWTTNSWRSSSETTPPDAPTSPASTGALTFPSAPSQFVWCLLQQAAW